MDRLIDDLRAFVAWAAVGSDVAAAPGEQILRDLVKFAMVATAFPLIGWAPAALLAAALWAKELLGDLSTVAEADNAARDIASIAAGCFAGGLALASGPVWAAAAPLGWAGAALWASGAVVAFVAWRERGRPE